MSKRAFNVCDTSSPDPPPKRRHLLSSSSPSSGYRTDASLLRTPHTGTPPRKPTQYPIVSDSPTNPFGRKRAQSFVLPCATSFGKHLALRFQLVRDGTGTSTRRGGDRDKDGVYRIAQVPMNYTFRLLHKLLFFLFNNTSSAFIPPPTTTSRNNSSTRTTRKAETQQEGAVHLLAHNNNNNKKTQCEMMDESGHLFEAKRAVVMHRAAYKAGRIRNAQTWAKLSSVRDPYRYLLDDDAEEAFDGTHLGGGGGGGGVESDAGDEEAVEWRWEAEEDITLAQVWPKGPDLSRGVVYYHDSQTQIHITVNTLPVPPRKGVGNQPFVFHARGVVVSLGGNHAADADSTTIQDVPAYRWNKPHAFEKFLKQSSSAKPMAKSIEDTGNAPSTSASVSSPSFPTPGLSTTSSAASTPACDLIHTPITPGPTHPIHQLRLDHTHKRIARLAKKGMDELAELGSDEDDEEPEVDELTDELADEGPEAEAEADKSDVDDSETWEGMVPIKGGKKSWRGTLHGWDWDPFRDDEV